MDDTTNRALHSLDLAPGASIDDVKKSYRELALIWHPDKVPDRVKDRATAKFTEINEAYQWIVRHPEDLRVSSSRESSSYRQQQPRYRSSSQSSRTGTDGPGADRSTGTEPGQSDRSRTGSSSDPIVQRIRRAARGTWTDVGAGLYIHPEIDADRAANFIVSLQRKTLFKGAASTVNDLLVFYDIDGSGEEGMAITRSNHLVNNNTSTLYDIGELAAVKLKEGFFFWCEILVRRRGQRRFELAGYAEKSPGRALANILQNLVTVDRGG